MIKWCNKCKIGVEVEEDDEQYWNYCHICGTGLTLVSEEEIFKDDNVSDWNYFKKDPKDPPLA